MSLYPTEWQYAAQQLLSYNLFYHLFSCVTYLYSLRQYFPPIGRSLYDLLGGCWQLNLHDGNTKKRVNMTQK